MVIWNHTPIITISWICDSLILFDKAIFKIMCCPSSVKCSCRKPRQLDITLEIELKFITVFGNNLCVILSISKDANVKTLFSLATTEFICGAYVHKRHEGYFLFTVSISGSSKIYSLSTPGFLSAHLLQNVCITNSAMLYCTRFVDCLCRHAHSPICVGGTSSRIFVWSFVGKSLGTTSILSHFGIQKGIIFAVDLCKPSFTSTCLLASAAEDRSIVIWSSQFDELCGSPQSRFTEWNILHRLDVCAINLKMPLFESRVWCVQMNDWGIIAAGEDCSLVCCPWPSSGHSLEPIILRSVHRGRSIWGLDTRVSKATTKMQIITGGNDGALVLNQIEIPQPEEKVGVFQDGLVGCVKPLTNVPAVKRPSSLAKHSFPSDTYFNQFPDKKQSLLLDNESVMISPVLRDVFIGPEGRIFTIFESGGIAILRPDNGKAAELTPMQSYLSPTLSKRVAKGAEFVDKDGVCLKQDRLFPGYCVSGVHRGSRRFALGGRWGCLGIYEIIDDETLLCHDLVNLPPFQRITLIHWISESEIVVGIFPNVTVYIGLNNVASSNGLFHRALYLERNFTHSQRDELAWTTCAASWTSQEPIPLRCIIIGTRVGGISLYNLPSDSNSTVIQPTWSLEHCHGREGVTSITILHQAIVLTAGRQHGRVRRWRILITEGGSKIGLQLLDQVLKPSHLSWIESFASLPSGEVLALGFLSTRFLAVEFLPLENDCPISDGGAIHLAVDCSGGHRAWDFAYVPQDDSLVFTAIRKEGLLYTHQRAQRARTTHGFMRTCLIPPLHGRDINTSLLLSRLGCDGQSGCLSISCYTGSEEFRLGSFTLDVQLSEVAEDCTVSSLNFAPRFHSGHISNIRCIAQCHQTAKHRPLTRYLVSGGGRGMLVAWRLDEADQPGLVGWVCLDTSLRGTGPLISCPLERKRSATFSVCDLRIMALLAFQQREGDNISVLAACSDGSIRLVKISLPCESTGWLPRFYQLADFRSGHRRSCILSLCCITQPTESRVSIAYSNTSGVVEAFKIDLDDGSLHKQLFSLHLEVENPTTKAVASCAANSIAMLADHIAIAGDDGSLRLANLRGVWITKAVRHFAAVVKVTSLSKQNCLLTLGADHRLLLWQVMEGAKLSVLSETMLTGLGDPQNISLLPTDEAEKAYLAMVCGSGLQLCYFKFDQ
uniref:WD repeat containing protein 6 n=1 Tax=Echinococcus granulosus TaxID=6210 RepID=A0A068WQZ6_ECHGR|nr:WD repeat containing protein 6 [Echinococcus granulosus]